MYEQDLFVCDKCFEDHGLIAFIRSNASANECSFCSAIDDGPIAASIDDVSEHFIECLLQEYALAVNQLGWTGSEGGYYGQHWDAEKLALDELELEFPQDNPELLLPPLFGEYYDQAKSTCKLDFPPRRSELCVTNGLKEVALANTRTAYPFP